MYAVVALAAVGGMSLAAQAATAVPAGIAAAVADPARPAADVQRDADRKPGELLAFIGVKPGDKVADLMPGGGYFTRLFSGMVGPTGAVYAYTPPEFTKGAPPPANGSKPDPARPNITALSGEINAFSAPEPLDVVWTSQNYHDLHDAFSKGDVSLVNAAVFKALKPGGVYVIVDHVAAPGAGLTATQTLHRIEPSVVRAEVEAAGFKFDGETDVVRNPADPHTAKVFDPSIRGKTDQFAFRFRKPG